MLRPRSRTAECVCIALTLGCQGETTQERPSEAEPLVAPHPGAPDPAAAPTSAQPTSAARDERSTAEDGTQIQPAAPPTPAPALAAVSGPPTRMTIGRTHVCVLEASGHPMCWGDARDGRLGTPSHDLTGSVQLESLTALSLAGGDAHTCGLAATGEAMCWGSNALGQLGIDGEATATPTRLPFDGVALQLSAGGVSTCAVLEGRGLWCRGPGGLTQRIDAVDPARAAVGPEVDGCVLDSKGVASCWSWTPATGTSAGEPRATVVEGLPPSVDIGVGDRYACALGHDRRVRCWGSNEGQRLGLPSSVAEASSPTLVPALPDDVVQLAVGARSSCALRDGGAVWCWGVGTEGQLGRGVIAASGAAARVRELEAATTVAVGYDRACALAKDGTPWCWGVGPGTPVAASTQVEPARLVALADLQQCATTEDGRVACWYPEEEATPATFVEGVEGATSLALPDGGGCAVVDGRARCWGMGASTASRPDHDTDSTTVHPIDVEDVRRLDAIMERVCAIDGKGRVWCWGWANVPDDSEMLPFGPTLVAGLDDADQLALSRFDRDCARRTGGTLVCWRPPRPSGPGAVARARKLARMPPVIAIAADQGVCALTTAHEVWCTEQETGRPQRVPVELPRPADAIATNITQTCVRFEDRTVGCWSNDDAYLTETPILVAPAHGLRDVEQLVIKAERACARRGDGTSACWVTPPPRVDLVPTASMLLHGVVIRK